MPGRVRKFNKATETDLKMRVIWVLDTTPDDVRATIDWIRSKDMMLSQLTTQKLSRILSSLAESGLVKKAKSKSLGRMVYKLTSKMREEGYNVEDVPFPQSEKEWNGIDWELEELMKEKLSIGVAEEINK